MTDIYAPGQLLRGSDFKDVKLYKILNDSMTHYGFHYKMGLNTLEEKFNPSGDCDDGGLYITAHPYHWIMMGTHIASVTLPNDALVWTGNIKMKVNMLILRTITEIPDNIYLQSICADISNFRLIPEERRTIEMYRMMIKTDPASIVSVPSHLLHDLFTSELSIILIRRDGLNLKYLFTSDKTPELCRLAVEINGNALNLVPPILCTPKLCAIAVATCPLALYSVPYEHRTLEICLTAVKQDRTVINAVPNDIFDDVRRALHLL